MSFLSRRFCLQVCGANRLERRPAYRQVYTRCLVTPCVAVRVPFGLLWIWRRYLGFRVSRSGPFYYTSVTDL